jgi:pyruvate-formate lyase-activating enzyme
MRCAFCQNGDISTDKDNGEETDPRALAAMAWTLRREGCHNINWVGGEVVIQLHEIVHAIALLGRDFAPTQAELRRARKTKADRFLWFDEVPGNAVYDDKFNAPMLWNSNFFITTESMKILRVLTDVWLPDFKFGPGRCAMTLAKTHWYWETVTSNLALIAEWGEDFSIRHLVMPHHVECCTYPVLEWIVEHVPKAPVNVMAQFHPDNFCDPASDKYRQKYRDRTPTNACRTSSFVATRARIGPEIRDHHVRAIIAIHQSNPSCSFRSRRCSSSSPPIQPQTSRRAAGDTDATSRMIWKIAPPADAKIPAAWFIIGGFSGIGSITCTRY